MKAKIQFGLFLLFITLKLSAQNVSTVNIDSLFTKFRKESFYGDIYPAKRKLENYQKKIIPELINLLKDTSFVKLTGTADLIYPGSTTYFGHGHYIPYDMDWISARSGWLLEDLTFQDFGYKNSEVTDEMLLNLMKEKYPDYIKKGSFEIDWKNKTSRQKNIEYRNLLSIRAEKWWEENKKKWNRISAIKDALKSNNENRLSKVLQYLRYGESICDNLNIELYQTEIRPIIIVLRQANKFPEIQEQIELLLAASISPKIIDEHQIQKM